MTIKREINNLLGSTAPIVTRLIVINVLVFLLANLYHSFNPFGELLDYLTLPASPRLFIHRPWTIITYMFLHINFMHILMNMLWLYWMGRLFAEYMGEKRLFYTYMLGGISGGLLFMLTYGVAFPQPDDLLGASAGIMAIIIAIAGLIPEYEVFLFLLGSVKLKYLALAIFLITSVVDFTVNSGGKVSHIGGAVYGLIYVWQYRKGNDITRLLVRFFDRIDNLFTRKKKSKLTSTRGGKAQRAVIDKQKRIDEILDKISHSGYDSLSKEEKDFLFKSSKEGNK